MVTSVSSPAAAATAKPEAPPRLGDLGGAIGSLWSGSALSHSSSGLSGREDLFSSVPSLASSHLHTLRFGYLLIYSVFCRDCIRSGVSALLCDLFGWVHPSCLMKFLLQKITAFLALRLCCFGADLNQRRGAFPCAFGRFALRLKVRDESFYQKFGQPGVCCSFRLDFLT